MCTLIIVREEGRIRLAANRDERLDRPSSVPRWHPLPARGGAGLWPVDEEAGGTWIGRNERGLLAALTNRFWTPVQKGRPSRGRWVPEALRHATAQESLAALTRQIEPKAENGFHLLIADTDQAAVLVSDGARLRKVCLPMGASIITERSFGPEPPDRELRLWRALGSTPPSTPRLLEALAIRSDPSSIDDVDVQLPEHGYGTRSRSYMTLGASEARFLYREVRPRASDWEDYH